MTYTDFHVPTRARRALSAAALGVLTAAVAVSPASGAIACDGYAAGAEDYAAELACASEATTGEQVITLTANFTVPSEHMNIYEGSQPLTVQGAHPGITITGPGRGDLSSSFLAVGAELSNDGPTAQGDDVSLDVAMELQAAPAEDPAHDPSVTVKDVTITQFGSPLINVTTGPLTIDGLTASSNGQGIESDSAFAFGGAVASAGDVTITDSTFDNNDSIYGGAVSTMLALVAGTGPDDVFPSVTVSNSTFTDNSSAIGGAILSFGDATITDSTFTSNSAMAGGAVGIFGETSAISDSTFTQNSAAAVEGMDSEDAIEAGAIAIGGALTVTNSVLTENSSEGIGGAIAYSYGPVEHEPSLTIVDSSLERNTAAEGGGAVWFFGGVDIAGSTFGANSSAEGPGAVAIEAQESDVTVTNSTITGNDSGAAVPAVAIDNAAELTVTHATFADNLATGGAHDLGIFDADLTTLTASVWASSSDVPSCSIDGELATVANFDVDGSCTNAWSGSGDFGEGIDAQLSTLGDNGGPTPTLLPAASSPLIDAVVDGGSDLAVDQRGVARPQGEAHDAGAVEVVPQGSLIEFEVATDAGTIYGTASPAIDVMGIEWIATGDLETPPPADTALPYGAAGFTVEVPEPGDSVTITLTAPRPFNTLLKTTNGAWSEVGGATFSNGGTTVTYTLTDGGELDEDGEANGFIVDPVALAVQATFTG